MKAQEVFKRYDIRGRYPEEIDEEFAERIGKALGTFTAKNFSKKTIVVGRDNKESSTFLKKCLINGLISTGMKVVDVGVGPTDYTAFTGKEHNSVSVQVTSSHMPLNFNGFKFMYPEGNGFVNKDLNTVKDFFRTQKFLEESGKTVDKQETAKKHYKNSIKEVAGKIGRKSLDVTVAVDTLGGAANEFLPSLLEEMGAEVIDISERYSEQPYRDPPNTKPEQLDELRNVVEKSEADIGLGCDMDGDRVAAYTESFLSGDKIFSILAQKVSGDVVASIDTSNALEDLLEQREDEVFYTRVGDPFVMDKALEESVSFAGEPNGHYSILDFVPYNSGTLIGLILAGTDIESCLEEKPKYYVDKYSFETDKKYEKIERIKEEVKKKYIFVSDIDGVKFDTGNLDVLVRPSGSSPKIRVIAESQNKEKLNEELGELREFIEGA